jgi:hypothetical protein
MKRASRLVLAFIWLTIGYWVISFVVPLVLLFLPFARSSGGISWSASNGIYRVQFPGSPGDVIALLYVTQRGGKDIAIPTDYPFGGGASNQIHWSNAYSQLLITIVFGAVSIPVLRRLLRKEPNQSLEPTAGRCDDHT